MTKSYYSEGQNHKDKGKIVKSSLRFTDTSLRLLPGRIVSNAISSNLFIPFKDFSDKDPLQSYTHEKLWMYCTGSYNTASPIMHVFLMRVVICIFASPGIWEYLLEPSTCFYRPNLCRCCHTRKHKFAFLLWYPCFMAILGFVSYNRAANTLISIMTNELMIRWNLGFREQKYKLIFKKSPCLELYRFFDKATGGSELCQFKKKLPIILMTILNLNFDGLWGKNKIRKLNSSKYQNLSQ